MTIIFALGLGVGGEGPSVSIRSAAAQDEQTAAATKEALARALTLLQRANQLEEQDKLHEAFDVVREAISIMERISGVAEMATRQYMQGQGYSLLGKIVARAGQLEDAVKTWTAAMDHFAPFYEADVEFWRQAARPGSGFEHAASNIAATLDFLSQASEAQKRPEEAILYMRAESDFFDKLGQKEMVLKTRLRMLAIFEANPQLPNSARRRAETLSEVAVAMVHVEQAAESLALLEEAERTFASLPAAGDPELATARANLKLRSGYALQANGRHSEATRFLSQAAADFASLDGQVANRISALQRLFASLFALEHFPQAADVLREQIEVAQQSRGLERNEYQARSHLVMVYQSIGSYDLAQREFKTMREIARRVDIPVADQARDFINIGVVHRENGAHAEALESFGEAVRLLEGLPGTEVKRGEYHIDLANALTALGRPAEARTRLERGLALLEGVNGAEIAAAKLRQLLAEDAERRLGRKGEGYRECERVVATFAKVPGANEIVLSCLVNIGRELQRQGRFDQAEAAFRQALDRLSPPVSVAITGGSLRADPPRTRERWTVLTGLGLASMAAGRHREATAHLLAAAGVGRDRFLDALMGMSMLERYRYIESNRRQRRSADIAVALSFRSRDAAAALTFEAAVSNKSLFTEVSRRQREAVNRARGPDEETLARRYVDLRRRVAQHVIDWQRGDSTAGAKSEVVEALFGEIREVERMLVRPIRSGSEGAEEESGLAGRIASALNRDQVLLEFVRFVPLDMAAVRDMDLKVLGSDDARAQHYGVFVASGATRTVTAVELGPAARIDDAVLEYRRTQQRQSAPATFNPDEAALATAAEPLRRALLDPLAPYLRGARRLYVAAEGQLSLVSFEAIPVRTAAGRPHYLVEDHEIVYLATGRDLLRSAQPVKGASSREMWLVGDPDFDAPQSAVIAAVGAAPPAPGRTARIASAVGALVAEPQQMGAGDRDDLRQWSKLDRTRDLLDTVSSTARASGLSPVVLTGPAASELNVARMRAPRLVVFATHGKFIDRAPTIRFTLESLSIGLEGTRIEGLSDDEMLSADPLFRSMLVLAGANRAASAAVSGEKDFGDGLLTAYEVWGLDLDGTELVVLTACESGLGVVQSGNSSTGLRQPTGEVVAGLRQAFMVAGAQSMVMSMWPVPLGETVRLFDRFFDGWLGAGENRYAAFRSSQLEALRYARAHRGSGHPFWWAGFVYMGDPGDGGR